MVKKSFSEMPCSLAQAMDVIGEWWTMLIIRDFFLGNGRRRFEQLRDSLGISRNILTERLKTLTEAGVIERVPLQEGGRRHAYQLTGKGSDLLPIMVATMQWWDKYADAPGCGYWRLRDREHDEEIAPVTVRSARGALLSYTDIYMTARTGRGEYRVEEWPPKLSDDSLDQTGEGG